MPWPITAGFALRSPDPRPIREIEQEITDEFEFHIEMRALDNARAGMSAADARQDAARRFGDFERIHKTCRRTLLGERIMLQRVQTVLMLVLVGAVVLLAVAFYRGQRANEAATTTMLEKLERFEQTAAPSVVATVPKTGQRDVDSSLAEIRVTYNKSMMDGNWSWCYDTDELDTTGEPRYETDGKTCVLPVKLRPGKTYTIRLNTDGFRNFMDASGQSAVPYLLQFETRSEAGSDGAEKRP